MRSIQYIRKTLLPLFLFFVLMLVPIISEAFPKVDSIDYWSITFGGKVKEDSLHKYFEFSVPKEVVLEDFNNTKVNGMWTFHVRAYDFKTDPVSLPQSCEIIPVKFTDATTGKVISTAYNSSNTNPYYHDAAFSIQQALNKTSITLYDKSHFYRDYLVTGDIDIWVSRYKHDALYLNMIYSRILNVIVLGYYDYRADAYLLKNANGIWKKLEPKALSSINKTGDYYISDATQEESEIAEKYIKTLGITGTGLPKETTINKTTTNQNNRYMGATYKGRQI